MSKLTRRRFIQGAAAVAVLPTFTADQPPVSDNNNFANEFYRACIEANTEISLLAVAVKQFQRGEIGREEYLAALRRADKFNLVWVVARVAGVSPSYYSEKTWSL